jgi:hypothetical protein
MLLKGWMIQGYLLSRFRFPRLTEDGPGKEGNHRNEQDKTRSGVYPEPFIQQSHHPIKLPVRKQVLSHHLIEHSSSPANASDS